MEDQSGTGAAGSGPQKAARVGRTGQKRVVRSGVGSCSRETLRGIFVRFFDARKPYLALNRPERFREQRVSHGQATERPVGARRRSEKRATGARFAEEALTLCSTVFTRSQTNGATKYLIG
jgi:hypothetical protein